MYIFSVQNKVLLQTCNMLIKEALNNPHIAILNKARNLW